MIRVTDMKIGESGLVCWVSWSRPTLSFLLNKEVYKIAEDIIRCDGKTLALCADATKYVGVK